MDRMIKDEKVVPFEPTPVAGDPKWRHIKRSEYDRLLAAQNQLSEVRRIEREAARQVVEQVTWAATLEIAHLENRIFDLERGDQEPVKPRTPYPY